MSKDKIYIIILFFVSLLGSLLPKSHFIGETFFFKALLIYWIFTVLSFHLRTISKKGNVTIDYGLNYSLSFILIFGPAGLLVYESLFRITAYFYKKVTKTDDPEEFLHIFYNIGSFVLQNTITFFLYQILNRSFSGVPFGFWILMWICKRNDNQERWGKYRRFTWAGFLIRFFFLFTSLLQMLIDSVIY